jgi:CRP-like cAMP-binding protein
MLRTNQKFLDFIQGIYDSDPNRHNIVIKSFAKGQKLLYQDQAAPNVMLIQSGFTKCFLTKKMTKNSL